MQASKKGIDRSREKAIIAYVTARFAEAIYKLAFEKLELNVHGVRAKETEESYLVEKVCFGNREMKRNLLSQ